MQAKQLFSTWVLLVVAAIELVNHGVVSNCDGSDHHLRGYTAKQSLIITGVGSANSTTGSTESLEGSSDADDSSLSESSSSIAFPTETTATPEIELTEQPMSTPQASTEVPTTTPSTTTPATTEPAVEIEYDSTSSSQSDESSASASDPTQSTTSSVLITGATMSSESSYSDSFDSSSISSSIEASESSSSDRFDTSSTSSSNDASASAETGSSSESDVDDGEASIAQPGSDSSTFQNVAGAECSKDDVDNVYTLYSNCRSAFDLCVSASDYQIFPFQGKQPTQAQIQGMAESDACIAVFIVVIEANFSACTIGGMPLVSAVETLLKISVDLQEGWEDEAPSTDVFQELLAWRYAVDLAKVAGVPYDSSSDLYAEFETNLNAALKSTAIRVNEDLSVDVRLTNGSYETFEDAIDLVVTDASAADLVPGYVIASSETGSSSESSSHATGIVSESSIAVASCTPTLWSLVIAVVSLIFVLSELRV